jgi:hypothetical protein
VLAGVKLPLGFLSSSTAPSGRLPISFANSVGESRQRLQTVTPRAVSVGDESARVASLICRSDATVCLSHACSRRSEAPTRHHGWQVRPGSGAETPFCFQRTWTRFTAPL